MTSMKTFFSGFPFLYLYLSNCKKFTMKQEKRQAPPKLFFVKKQSHRIYSEPKGKGSREGKESCKFPPRQAH